MLLSNDQIINNDIPFLGEKTVLVIDDLHVISPWDLDRSGELMDLPMRCYGYRFISFAYLERFLRPEILKYIFPGLYMLKEGFLDYRIEQLTGIRNQSGFLYRRDGVVRFHKLPVDPTGEGVSHDILWADIHEFMSALREPSETERSAMPRMMEAQSSRSAEPAKPRRSLFARIFRPSSGMASEGGSLFDETIPSASEEDEATIELQQSVAYELPIESEEPDDPHTVEVIAAWKELSRSYGITIEELEGLLGYRRTLSSEHITKAGKITLPGLPDCPEARMDDLTKALYFLYLRHPEGMRQKDVQLHEAELHSIYLGITGRDDPEGIRTTVHNFVDPYGNGLNVGFSRIKRAFKNIMDDRLAKNYYVQGKAGEVRTITLNRDLVIWEP